MQAELSEQKGQAGLEDFKTSNRKTFPTASTNPLDILYMIPCAP